MSMLATSFAQATGTGTVSRGRGRLCSITVVASSAGNVSLYDNISAAGRLLWTGLLPAVGTIIQWNAGNPFDFGLHLVLNSGTCTLDCAWQ